MYWLARGEHELPQGEEWLTPDERGRLSQLRYTKRRTEYLLRRWTSKQAVAAALGWPPDPGREDLARIAVRNHPTGAPYVHVDGAPLGSDISVTDRSGWAVCLVAPSGSLDAVGVDLELVEPRSDGFVEDYLTAPERDWVRGLPTVEDRHVAANLLWSAKEAALKVLRTGLRADTRTVEVTVSPVDRADGWGALTVVHTSGRTFPGWWRRDGVFVLTMAFTSPTDPPSLLPASADLTAAVPVDSWLANPLAW